LADEEYEARRAQILGELRRTGRGSPCEVLGGFRSQRNERVRENAVRALSDAGCDRFPAYRPYLDDPNPWVTEWILRAVERRLMTEAVPFLIDRLSDRRRILSGDGFWIIGETAHRVLREVTCQSFHFDPEGPEPLRQDALSQWRQWYAAHRGEPRQSWVAAGIALGRDYVGRDYAPHRLEGLRLLALIGPPAFPALRGALERHPDDLLARVVCAPEEPPRVTDAVPCALEIENATRRRLALVPRDGPPEVQVRRREEAPPPPPPRGGATSRGARSRSAPESPPKAPAPVPLPAPVPAEIAGSIVDLAPGEVYRVAFSVGPVPGAGRYDVRVRLRDLAAALVDPSPVKDARTSAVPGLPPIEAGTMVRFEQ
jgi:hypothetical protein